VPLIADAGHGVYPIDLPGSGADETPRAEVNLTRYQQAVIDFVQARDLIDLVVVGHSLGGGTLTLLAPALSARIRGFVFLAAIVPGPEQSLLDFVPAERREFYRKAAATSRDGTFKVSYQTARAIFFEELSEARAREAYGRLTPQSLAVYLETLANQEFFSSGIPCEYVLCSKDKTLPRETCLEQARRLGVESLELDSGHDAMLSHPDELAELLLSIVRFRGPGSLPAAD